MALQQIHSQGIYHGLPVYDAGLRGLTAIITGANGISGHALLRVLAQAPQRWTRIICLSRRPPRVPAGAGQPSAAQVEHIPLDFLREPNDIAAVLESRGVGAVDYVFFFSYIQPPPRREASGAIWSDAEELVRVNVALLGNFLEALTLAGIAPKRFLLQTGAKNYGLHLGPTTVPQEESDPRVILEPNFYYPQEDLLWSWAKRTKSTWTVCMPGAILGAVPDAAMNLAFPLAVYAAVHHHQQKKTNTATHRLEFPSDAAAWQNPQIMSSATLNAYQEEWAALAAPPDHKFNTCDGGAFTWEKFWPRLAGWYGLESGPPTTTPDADVYLPAETTPFVPRGYGEPAVSRRRFRTAEWAQREETRTAWREIAEQYGLAQPVLKDVERVFGLLDFCLGMTVPTYYSTDKARKLGWHGFVDSSESFLEVFDGLAALKMIPPVPKIKVSFN